MRAGGDKGSGTSLITVVPAKAWSFAGVSIGMPIAGGTPRACQREPQRRSRFSPLQIQLQRHWVPAFAGTTNT
jgi:hypothetical protein